MLGGWIADRWIGQRNAVVLGALLMSGGHLAMAFDQSFLFALLLLIIGSGLLKGNISAQVGSSIRPTRRRAGRAASPSSAAAINIGAVLGPLVCGFLGARYGWHVGFGAAAAAHARRACDLSLGAIAICRRKVERKARRELRR